MYIKLGSTKINYISPRTDDFMILSEVVDSSLSYHRPVLVRTTEELDIWFGDNFTDRDYFLQLLNSGIVLFLYKPIQDIPDTTSPGYVDYSGYEVIDEVFNNISDIEEKYIGENKYKKIFRLISEHKYTEIIFLEDIEISTELDKLPQNLNFISNSQNNRDTLVLLSNSGYLSPSFNNSSDSFFKRDNTFVKSDLNKVDYDKLSTNHLTCSFKIRFDKDFLKDSKNNYQYLSITTFNESSLEYVYTLVVISDFETRDNLLEYLEYLDLEVEEGVKEKTKYLELEILHNNRVIYFDSKKFLKTDLIKVYSDLGYSVYTSENNSYLEGENNVLEVFHGGVTESVTLDDTSPFAVEKKTLVYNDIDPEIDEIFVNNPYLVPVNYFYNIQGFSMTPEFNLTNDQLYSKTKDDNILISFVSKTIGTGGELGNIKVNIEDLGDGIYRIILERFGYSELYEGKLVGNTEEIRLDHQINNNSKLVECQLGLRVSELPEGTWYLRGGKKEETTPENYMKSLECLFTPPEPIYFDYLLIPDIEKYTYGPNDNLYYPEYEKILDYSKELGNQVLIQNSDNTDNTGNVYNTYKFNYVGDKDNRLIYFFRDMEVYGKKRPGYYVYLNDLIFNDRYSPSVNYILYKTPESTKDNYLGSSDFEKELESKKCNYLVENNHIYYYRKYQNGTSYNSTCWMRFCLDKIKRELAKNKWWILEDKDVGKIRERISSILTRISKTFSIIRKIELTGFSVSFKEQMIDLTIDTSVSDLVDNNIRIDITLNYYT